jgi:hypothetical protein
MRPEKYQAPERSPLHQGVISKYFDDKGYGFIKDEKGEDYFFHFNQVLDKIDFRARVQDYLYADRASHCYLLRFRPSENAKGKYAQDIMLTEECLFDRRDTERLYVVKASKVEYIIESMSYIQSGIKKHQPEPMGATAGGNGTYRIGYPDTFRYLSLSFGWKKFTGGGQIDILPQALRLNGRKKVTTKFLNQLKAKLVGTELEIYSDGQEWKLLTPGILLL